MSATETNDSAPEEQQMNRFPFLQRYPPNPKLLKSIPSQAQKGFRNIDIAFKCLDVCEQYIAIGTNIGIVYLYDRRKDKLHKLKNGEYKDPITCVKLLVSLECLVAVGTGAGSVFAFKVPFKDTSEIEKFKVEGMHKATITALEWVKNGIKFYSGDSSGVVVGTEIDHLEHQSVSNIVLEENSEIVQLSYSNLSLLVSTLHRSLMHDFRTNQSLQVGQKDRKLLGRFGATFFQNISVQSLYLCRPGQRIWKSDCSCVISETILLKEALALLSDDPYCGGCFKDYQFGPLTVYCSEFLLTWSDNYVVLIDPVLKSVKSLGYFANIVDVVTNRDEIFILQGIRNVVRVAVYAESEECFVCRDIQELFVPQEEFTIVDEKENNQPDSAEGVDPSKVFDWIKRKFSEVSLRQEEQDSPDFSRPGESKSKGSVLPDVVALDVGHLQLQTSLEMRPAAAVKTAEKVYEVNDEIVYKPKRKKKKKKQVQFSSDATSDSTMGYSDLNKVSIDSKISTSSDSTDQVDSACSSSSLKEVNLNLTLSSEDKSNESVNSISSESAIESASPSLVSSINEEIASLHEEVVTTESPAVIAAQAHQEDIVTTESNDITSQDHRDDTGAKNSEEVDVVKPSSPVNTYSSLFFDNFPKASKRTDLKENKNLREDSEENRESSSSDKANGNVSDPPKYGSECVQYKSPGPVVSLSASNHRVFCVDSQDSLFVSDFPSFTFHWMKLDQPAEQVAVSPSESVIWVLYRGVAYAPKRRSADDLLHTVEWVSIARSVLFIAVSDTFAWYTTWDGHLFVNPNLSVCQPYSYPQEVYCPNDIVQVACKDEIVWVLTNEGKLYHRVSMGSSFQKSKWKEILLPGIPSAITAIAFDPKGTAYVMADDGTLCFRVGVCSSSPTGSGNYWQVESSNYIYEPVQKAKNMVSLVISGELLSSFIHGQSRGQIIACSEGGLWWSKSMDSSIYSYQKFVIGHFWRTVVPKGTVSTTQWYLLSVEDFSDSHDIFWGCSSNEEMMCISPKQNSCIVVELPSSGTVKCIQAVDSCVWTLTSEGHIYTRREISERCCQGMWWQELDTSQLYGVKLCHMSCSSEVVWACDGKGKVFVRIGTLQPISGSILSQAWICVDSDLNNSLAVVQKSPSTGKAFSMPSRKHRPANPVFVKVYVGPKSYMVWAIDDRGLVYVRNNITPNLLVGSEWLFVPAPRAKQLSISADGVWLVKYSGKIYRRFGITKNNPTGDYWKQIPGRISFLSVSSKDDVWGIRDNSLYRHFSHTIQYGPNKTKRNNDDAASISDDDWEDVAAGMTDEED